MKPIIFNTLFLEVSDVFMVFRGRDTHRCCLFGGAWSTSLESRGVELANMGPIQDCQSQLVPRLFRSSAAWLRPIMPILKMVFYFYCS